MSGLAREPRYVVRSVGGYRIHDHGVRGNPGTSYFVLDSAYGYREVFSRYAEASGRGTHGPRERRRQCEARAAELNRRHEERIAALEAT